MSKNLALQPDGATSEADLRSMTGRYLSYLSWAKTADRTARTAPARRAAEARFERMVDPDGKMTPEARAKAAEAARRAHFQLMAKRSAESRRRKRQMAAGA